MPFPFEFPKFACCCPPPPPEGDELVEDEGTWHEQSRVFVSQSEQYMQTSWPSSESDRLSWPAARWRWCSRRCFLSCSVIIRSSLACMCWSALWWWSGPVTHSIIFSWLSKTRPLIVKHLLWQEVLHNQRGAKCGTQDDILVSLQFWNHHMRWGGVEGHYRAPYQLKKLVKSPRPRQEGVLLRGTKENSVPPRRGRWSALHGNRLFLTKIKLKNWVSVQTWWAEVVVPGRPEMVPLALDPLPLPVPAELSDLWWVRLAPRDPPSPAGWWW